VAKKLEAHKHARTVHDHEHVHITRHCRGGVSGAVEHLVAAHAHSHNHSGLSTHMGLTRTRSGSIRMRPTYMTTPTRRAASGSLAPFPRRRVRLGLSLHSREVRLCYRDVCFLSLRSPR
jgi:hypothetical protein